MKNPHHKTIDKRKSLGEITESGEIIGDNAKNDLMSKGYNEYVMKNIEQHKHPVTTDIGNVKDIKAPEPYTDPNLMMMMEVVKMMQSVTQIVSGLSDKVGNITQENKREDVMIRHTDIDVKYKEKFKVSYLTRLNSDGDHEYETNPQTFESRIKAEEYAKNTGIKYKIKPVEVAVGS